MAFHFSPKTALLDSGFQPKTGWNF